jgi:hypothetical protein
MQASARIAGEAGLLRRDDQVDQRTMTFDVDKARARFCERLTSLKSDLKRCFQDIGDGRGPAYFPAALYSFVLLDYFSSHWAGWNDTPKGAIRNQTVRMVAFMEKYLKYDRKASNIAVQVWRHKLAHTAEPRVILSQDGTTSYRWVTGTPIPRHYHMTLIQSQEVSNIWVLSFDPMIFADDLEKGIFGENGYFQDLVRTQELQDKYLDLLAEFDSYRLRPI